MKTLTCMNCYHKTKNPNAINAFECSFEIPNTFPMMDPRSGQLSGVVSYRPPVTDTTTACHRHEMVDIESANS